MNDNQHSNDPLLAMLASFEGHVREIVSKAEREEAACRAAMDGNCSRHTADNDRISKQLTALEQEGENASATCKKAASAILSRLHAMRDHYAADAQNPSTLET